MAVSAKSADEARKPRHGSRKGRKGRQVESGPSLPEIQGEEAEQGFQADESFQEIATETESSAAGPLSMCRHDFSAETERQRVFGSGRPGPLGQSGQRRAPRPRGQVEGRTLHHRRLFLVSLNPSEPWVKPENSPRMVAKADQDGAAIFDFEETAASSRDLKSLRQIVGQEDPQLLQQYLQRNSFSLDGLLVMAEFHRHQGSHEQAREFVRRAVYTLECSLSPGFLPLPDDGLGTFCSSTTSSPRCEERAVRVVGLELAECALASHALPERPGHAPDVFGSLQAAAGFSASLFDTPKF